MKKTLYAIIISVLLLYTAIAQQSDPTLRKIGYLTGNNIGLSFYNDGQISGFNTGVDIRGEWPLGSGYTYIGDMIPLIGVEFKNSIGQTKHSVIISRGPRNHQSDEKSPIDGHFWGWNPLPGFVNPANPSVAMSHLPASWPTQWADHPEYGNNVWNGLFGPDSFVANQEAYFQIRDDKDDEFNGHFHPDSTDLTKKGMGINVAVRYFQLNDSIYKDVLIKMYDITNTGTTFYNKVVFGNIMGTLAGGDGDSQDDVAFLSQQYQCIFSTDGDGIGNRGQQVGVMGEALLESPSNSHDGIDNDGDSHDPASPEFAVADFDSLQYNIGNVIVLIDPVTYQRTIHTISAAVETVSSMGYQYIVKAGVTWFHEGQIRRIQNGVSIPDTTAYDRIDNDLDGLIDENMAVDLDIRTRQNLPAHKFVNYYSGAGSSDPLIDEGNDEIGIASCIFFNIGASPDMSDDELLWDRMRPGRLDVVPPQPQDGDVIYGTRYFSLAPGETKRIVSVLAFGGTEDEVGHKVLLARTLWKSKFNKDSLSHSIVFTNLNNHRILSGIEQIEWHSTKPGGKLELWYSSDDEKSWTLLDGAIPNTGTYQLNVNNLEDTPFGVFKMYIYDDQGDLYAYTKSHLVTVNGGGNGAPYIKLIYQGYSANQVVYDTSITMICYFADPESDSLVLKLSYSGDDGLTYEVFDSSKIPSDTLPQSINVKLANLRNSNKAKLKIELWSGDTSFSIIASSFKKLTHRDVVNSLHLAHESGLYNFQWRVQIIDSSKLTGHEYRLSFDDRDSVTYSKYITVLDVSSNRLILNHQPLIVGLESPGFDGLTFYSDSLNTVNDDQRGGWSGTISDYFQYYTFSVWKWSDSAKYAKYNGYPMPNDYAIIFYPTNVDTSLADTLRNSSGLTRLSATPVNFRVKNLTTDEFIKCAYIRNSSSLSTSYIFIFKENFFGEMKRTWATRLYYSQGNMPLPTHDTLFLYTKKGLSVYDTINVFNVTTPVLPSPELPASYRLEQNYPNPFNPATHFSYQVPNRGLVTLKIYDMLGREVTTLVNEIKPAGTYNLSWNATGLATGVYFYQLRAGDFIETKKLVLVR